MKQGENMADQQAEGKFSIDRTFLQYFSKELAQIREQREKIAQMEQAKDEIGMLQTELLSEVQNYETLFSNIYQLLAIDYRDATIAQIKEYINAEFTKALGVFLIQQRTTEKPLNRGSIVQTLDTQYWALIQTNLKENSGFSSVISKITSYYQNHLEKLIQSELNKVTFDIDPQMIEAFRAAYLNQPISFEDFLIQSSSRRSTSYLDPVDQSDAKKVREEYERELERKKLEEKKQKQEASFDHYKRYFNMDERELARIKRKGKDTHRAVSKISRREKFSKGGDK
jgi:hypothetical protein